MTGAPEGYIPPPEDEDLTIVLACLPVDTSGPPKSLGPPRQPTITDTLGQCRNLLCGQDVWVGEKQKHLMDTEQDRPVIILCYMCSAMTGSQEVYRLGPDQTSARRTS